MKVKVYTIQDGADKQLGSIAWDGREFQVEPSVDRLLRLLEEPVYDAVKGEPVEASEEPERFLELMPYQYRSPYFRVGPAEEESGKAEKSIHKGMGGRKPERNLMRDFPDERQPDKFSCGAASSMACGMWWGVGPKTLDGWKRDLGTTVERSTHPDAIIKYFQKLGCHVEARQGMTIDDLNDYTARGIPVIVCLQDYGPEVPEKAEFRYGHYICVLGVYNGMVFAQDSSIENLEREPGGDVPKSEAEKSGNIAASGRIMVPADRWMDAWHDRDVDDRPYVHFGIAVGPATGGTLRLRKSTEGHSYFADCPRDEGGHCKPSGQGSETRDEQGERASSDSTAPSEPPRKAKFGKSKAKVVLDDLAGGTVPERLDEIFGNAVKVEDLPSLVGALDDAEVTLMRTDRDNVLAKIYHPDYEAVRVIGVDKNGEIYIGNKEFWVNDEAQGKGIGTEVFGRQVENALDAGVAYIKCHAAKDNPQEPSKPHNGYYTWPRFGYDQSLEDFDEFDAAEFRAKKNIKKRFPAAKSILDVMATPEGRDWWKKNGTDLMEAKFDLTEGSRSRRIFDTYLEERTARLAAAKLYSGIQKAMKRPQPGIEEISLNDDDDRWLDAAWKRLDAQQKNISKGQPRGEFFHECDRDDLGHCKPGTGGGKKPSESKPSAKPANEPETHPGAAHGSTVKVTPTKRMAAPRDEKGKIRPVALKTQLTKQETGRVAEAGIRAYLRDIEGITDTVALNAGKTNESIDLFGDSMAPEVKGGLCSNSVKAQQWRITFSMELSKAEQAKYDTMTDEQQKAWREKRQRDCLKRKLTLLKKLSKERGKEIKPVTYTGIVNPDAKTIDIYRTDGYHQRIDWNDQKAKYLGSVEYSHAD